MTFLIMTLKLLAICALVYCAAACLWLLFLWIFKRR